VFLPEVALLLTRQIKKHHWVRRMWGTRISRICRKTNVGSTPTLPVVRKAATNAMVGSGNWFGTRLDEGGETPPNIKVLL